MEYVKVKKEEFDILRRDLAELRAASGRMMMSFRKLEKEMRLREMNENKDVIDDSVKNQLTTEDIQMRAEYYVCYMHLDVGHHNPYPVRDLLSEAILWFNEDEETMERVYRNILHKKPFGCYVTGRKNSSWKDDAFCLMPPHDEKYWLEQIKKVVKKMKARDCKFEPTEF